MQVQHSITYAEAETDRAIAKAKQVAENINKSGGKAIAVPGDMLDAEYLKTLVKKTAEFGNGKIHIIVNNAGSALNTSADWLVC
jgi:NAD(P)-dependent dehydrogenase (short-subunit alcohol dehydrogenase family)